MWYISARSFCDSSLNLLILYHSRLRPSHRSRSKLQKILSTKLRGCDAPTLTENGNKKKQQNCRKISVEILQFWWNRSVYERVWKWVWRRCVSQFGVQAYCISFKAHECQDEQTSLWCQRLCVVSDMHSESKRKLCSSGRDAGYWCFGSRKCISENPRTTMWIWSIAATRQTTECGVGHNEALDRTMTATGSRTVNGKAVSYIDSQSDRVDVANEVSLRKVSVSAVPLLEMSYPKLESNSKRSDVQSCVKECARGVRDRMQRATRICTYILCSSLFGAIEEIKCSLVAYGVPCGFLDFDRDSHSIEKNANTLKSKTIILKIPMSVFETKTFVSDTNSIIGFGACEASSGETQVLLLVNETWIWKDFPQRRSLKVRVGCWWWNWNDQCSDNDSSLFGSGVASIFPLVGGDLSDSATLPWTIAGWSFTVEEMFMVYQRCCGCLWSRWKDKRGRWCARGQRQVWQQSVRHDTRIALEPWWLEPRVFALSCCAALYVLCLWVYCLHPLSTGWRFFQVNETNYEWEKITDRQILKNASNPNCSSSSGFDPKATTMTTLSADFSATLCSISILFGGQPHSRILHCRRIVFSVLLVDCEEWFCSLAGSFPGARLAIVCILFSLEQSQVVDLSGCKSPSAFN